MGVKPDNPSSPLDPSAGPDQQYLAAIAELHPDKAFFAVDGQQRILYWSSGAEKIFGYAANEVLGSHCSKAIHCVNCAQACGLRRHHRIQDKSIEHYHRDGTKLALRKQAQAFFNPDGSFAGGVEVLEVLPEDGLRQGGGELPALQSFHGILTADARFLSQLTMLRHAAFTDVNILIRGESGSGKEMVARAIHTMSHRSAKPFVAINCGTLSREFLASELFGHKKGAFTGAINDKRGLLAEAEGGTLFLDEVAELPMDVQAMLLRVVQEKKYRMLGHTRDFPADVRILSATHESLRQAVNDRRFREDLMYRLRVVPVFLPPLRDRRVDIPLLWDIFAKQAAKKFQLPQAKLTAKVRNLFLCYPWPGNVRELMNVAEFLAVTRAGRQVLPEHLPPEFGEMEGEKADSENELRIEQAERAAPISSDPDSSPGTPFGKPGPDHIRKVLQDTRGNTQEAARILGVSRPTLWRWRKKFGLL